MHSFRYPQRLPNASQWSHRDNTLPDSRKLSLTGAAFAVTAAVLPLFRSRDVSICSGPF